ncbi:hypothetical protein WA1_51565 [Scytonema hofmannii PCC 7110]|uniref:Uncharacterized protein n=1 Tax=Scytonema hofmannii PCC 7110 TaxID=128403 RepID=A0A139WPY1_9CYAN|nr:hypothetical protein [Scytonema hofmannii]KYC34484.1 hypothetical protein WA1_51565 [Scytonema hofmannii PCC 7110]
MPKQNTEAIAYADTGTFDNGEGEQFPIDSPQFREWLMVEDNTSFRFECGDNSYRARREIYTGSVYWYAVKKVAGKVVRRSIARPDSVDLATLKAVAETIRKPVEKKVDSATTASVTDTVSKQPIRQPEIDELRSLLNEQNLQIAGLQTELLAVRNELAELRKNSLPRQKAA